MSNNEEIAQFIAVTGAAPEAALFYLDSAQGDVSAAVDAYYASGGEVPTAERVAEVPQEAVPPPRERAAGAPAAPAAPATRAARPTRQAAAAAAGRIRGLADLSGEGSGSEEDDSNEYYAGGEKSGQVVRGGDGRRGREVESLFERARQAGATLGSAADLEAAPAAKGGAFKGRARTLGGGSQESQEVAAGPASEQEPGQPVVHTITFWANGVFTVDDGEPRNVTDPSNRPFLEAIGRGECPPELAPPSPTTPINVNMVRSAADYQPPERPRHQAFRGQGRTLAEEGGGGASAAAVAAPTAGSGGEWEGVNESLPKTSLQLRLADGSRMVAQFNHGHTVGDIRRFIAASRPDMPAAYNLMTAFPQAQLSDNSQTLEQAGLLNAVVIQKM